MSVFKIVEFISSTALREFIHSRTRPAAKPAADVPTMAAVLSDRLPFLFLVGCMPPSISEVVVGSPDVASETAVVDEPVTVRVEAMS